MLKTTVTLKKYSLVADFVLLLSFGTLVYALVAFGREWRADFHQAVEIDLSLSSLPLYSLFSLLRALAAYFFSLAFTLVIGYWAAKSKKAESFIIPILDVLQSIPVLGFLPGLVLGLISIFPKTNVGLELASVIMIFTGQVWNMTFSYYASLKSIPSDLKEASKVMKMGAQKRFFHLDLPYAAIGLAWNSLMSMAGGWFFLTICEAFTLGDKVFRLPGLGSYMAKAIEKGNSLAMGAGIGAMIFLIIGLDFFVWRPVLAWVHRFRLEEVPGDKPADPIIQMIVQRAHLYRIFRFFGEKIENILLQMTKDLELILEVISQKCVKPNPQQIPAGKRRRRILWWLLVMLGLFFLIHRFWGFIVILLEVPKSTWMHVGWGMGATFLRVFFTLFISSLWAVPVGIWLGLSPLRVQRAQPLIQVLASFPAPMLYPLVLAFFLKIHMPFFIGSMFLMMLGVQWYILFNVLAGAMRIPLELKYMAQLMKVPQRRLWRKLYLPSVFPALVTGWVTAAGGAWNASIVAEFVTYDGRVLSTSGLGSTISEAASKADFHLLAASLTVMVITVVFLNRIFWSKIYHLTQTRYRMDL